MPNPEPTIDYLAGEALVLVYPALGSAYLDVACGGDTQLRAAVEERLAALNAEWSTPATGAEMLAGSPLAFDPASQGLFKGAESGATG